MRFRSIDFPNWILIEYNYTSLLLPHSWNGSASLMLFLRLCISRMSVMLKMQSIGLTILSLLAMRNASYLSEWAKGERGIGKPRNGKRASNQRPTKTLFVINFDPILTKEGDTLIRSLLFREEGVEDVVPQCVS
ncbi:hypothetical protein IGI04_010890 [Brassica rapa subsp. trilocularis]|uniref:Uncharacterized protein n=1 Tax=Brassica rapa subsp. trilocularis TaxID=1813537 RepID=A0ABQ7N3P7_BRACM|nr:hypothetical protein IGI04_010890 [Brassica rapa subsp. trilocularis]